MDPFLDSVFVGIKRRRRGGGGGFNKISRESKEFVREVFAPRRGGLELGLSEG